MVTLARRLRPAPLASLLALAAWVVPLPATASPDPLVIEVGDRGHPRGYGHWRPHGPRYYGPPPWAYRAPRYVYRPPAVVVIPGYGPPPPVWVVPPHRPYGYRHPEYRHHDRGGWEGDLWYGPQPPYRW